MLTRNYVASSVIVLAGGLFAAGSMANTGEKSHTTQASQGSQSSQLTFKDIDKNGDGQLSQSEFQTVDVQERLDHDALDTNNDDRIDRSEFAPFEQVTQDQQKQGQLTFANIDKNGDGYLGRSEFESVNVKERVHHGALDTNNDGHVDQSEFAPFEQVSQDKMKQQGQQTDSTWQTDPAYETDEEFESADPGLDEDY